MLSFYREHLGLELVEETEDRLELAPAAGAFQLTLAIDPDAPVRTHPTVGLYHLALLVPDRASLAAAFEHLREAPVQWQGASDHGVSQALYLRDPEGNGVELYWDRPREAWPMEGDQVAMVTEPLDLEDLLTASPGPGPLHAGTRLGHVHLHAGDLEASGAFYQDLGLHVTQDTYFGALFLALGDYHHHVGLNAWARGRRAPEGATGLVELRWTAQAAALEALEAKATGPVEGDVQDGSLVLEDPDGHRVRIQPSTLPSR